MKRLVNYETSSGLYRAGGLVWLNVDRIFTTSLNIASPGIVFGDSELIALTSQTDWTENGVYSFNGTSLVGQSEILFDGILIRGVNNTQYINPGIPNLDFRPLLIAHKRTHPVSEETYWQFDAIQNAHPLFIASPDGSIDVEAIQSEDGTGLAGAPILTFNLTLSTVPTIRVLASTNVANISTMTGPQTIDGVSLAAGDYFAAAGQTTATENDIWRIGDTGDAAARATFIPKRGTQFAVIAGTFANREFVVTQDVVRSGTPQGMRLQRIDGSLMSRAGSDANISIIATRTNELMLPRIYVGVPQLTGIRTYTLPATAGLIDGTEVILQFETNAPNFNLVVAPDNTGAGETINLATSWTFIGTAYRRAHIIFRGGDWWANQFA
jgi:hypothetical protein